MGYKIRLEEILLFTYGCGLDYSDINNFVKEKLSPFEIKWDDIPETVDGKRNILFRYDVYDVNLENSKRLEDIYFHLYLISEEHLSNIEHSLTISNNGEHTRCQLNAMGHIYLEINNIEYSARTLISIDKKTIIYLLDEEAENNALIRSQLHLLPTELHYLILDYGLSYEKRELKVRSWIQQIYNLINE